MYQGRICLFGEHTDWAGGHRRTNAELEKGYTLITSTNQGVYADVQPHPTSFILKTSLSDGTRYGPYTLPMEPAALLAEAEKGSFFQLCCRSCISDSHKLPRPRVRD